MSPSSIVGKLISTFIASYITTLFVILTHSEDIFFSLFIPVYFFEFAFICFVAVPITMLIEKVFKPIRNVPVQVLSSLILGSASYAMVALFLSLIGFNITRTLFLHGFVTLAFYFMVNLLIGLIEKKARMASDLNIRKA